MAIFMLDTDIASYVMKRSNGPVLAQLGRTPVSDICISVVTKAELLFGVEVSPRRDRDDTALGEFLRYVEVMEFPDAAAVFYARVRAALKRDGTMIGANDLWIAAHALYLGSTLVTNNVREFGRVEGLRVENWTESRL